MTYETTIDRIIYACSNLNMDFKSGHKDGRINSAIMEDKLLEKLQSVLNNSYPEIKVDIPTHRFWYDIKIDDIPINLKITSGGTDNAFNKNAIIYSIIGYDLKFFSGSFESLWYKTIIYEKKKVRDKTTEYHYLVFDKSSGRFLLKPIFDIHSYTSNPCNILQINWKNEFKNLDYSTKDEDYTTKVISLMKTIQKSVLADIESKRKFAEHDYSKLFEEDV